MYIFLKRPAPVVTKELYGVHSVLTVGIFTRLVRLTVWKPHTDIAVFKGKRYCCFFISIKFC